MVGQAGAACARHWMSTAWRSPVKLPIGGGRPPYTATARTGGLCRRLQPDAVVCVGTYPACAGFIRDMRDRDVDCPVATLSFVGGGAMLKLLSAAERESHKDYTSRLVSSQVVPSYNDDSVTAVREYR